LFQTKGRCRTLNQPKEGAAVPKQKEKQTQGEGGTLKQQGKASKERATNYSSKNCPRRPHTQPARRELGGRSKNTKLKQGRPQQKIRPSELKEEE
jgi:hypothetical protein